MAQWGGAEKKATDGNGNNTSNKKIKNKLDYVRTLAVAEKKISKKKHAM